MAVTTGAASLVEECTGCNLCVKECSFLQRTGHPAQLAAELRQCDPFECTLCGLCAAVCPFGVDPSRYFLERRRELRRARGKDDPRHAPLIGYEKRGTSSLYTYYGLPEGCDTVFFPGCALPGSRPEAVWQVYQKLKSYIPKVGIVLDCCLKPSHDLGREDHFNRSFRELRDHLYQQGVRKVLVACPNCNRIFSDYGDGISIQTVYEILLELPAQAAEPVSGDVVFHDPCVARSNCAAQNAARSLAARAGVTVSEMEHARSKTQCCGRGGGVNFLRPGIIDESIASRVAEAAGRPIVTYCAACAGTYASQTSSLHLLDLWMAPQEALAGKTKVSVAPMTYLNRIRLKARLRKAGNFKSEPKRGARKKRKERSLFRAAGLLLMMLAVAVVVGATSLHQW